MSIIVEITGIVIERPSKAVTEIDGIDIDGKKIRLRAVEPLKQVFYVRNPETGKDLILEQIKIGEEQTDVFFVKNPDNPIENLLVQMEKKLTGEPP